MTIELLDPASVGEHLRRRGLADTTTDVEALQWWREQRGARGDGDGRRLVVKQSSNDSASLRSGRRPAGGSSPRRPRCALRTPSTRTRCRGSSMSTRIRWCSCSSEPPVRPRLEAQPHVGPRRSRSRRAHRCDDRPHPQGDPDVASSGRAGGLGRVRGAATRSLSRGGGSPHAEVADDVRAVAQRVRERHVCLVHGDLSPKKRPGAPGARNVWLIDFEVAHRGDPVFDVASRHPPHPEGAALPPADGYLRAARAFVAAYAAGRGEAPDGRDLFTQIGALLTARVVGKSPAEYLDELQQARPRNRCATRTWRSTRLRRTATEAEMNASTITRVHAWEALDSRGRPTVACR